MKTKLSSKNLLQELAKPEYNGVLGEFSPVSYPKNMMISTPGHGEDLVFIVRKGRVRVYLAFEDKDFSLAILGEGDIYSTHTKAYVATLEDTELLAIPTAEFLSFMNAYPVFSKTVITVLGEMLKETFSIIESLVFKDVTQRIVEFLLHEARHHGKPGKEGVTVDIDLTVEQLAAVVGSSRQTASSILNQMLKTGVLVKSGRKKYLIPNPAVLKEFPNN